MRRCWSLPCHTRHNQPTSNTPCDQLYLRGMAVRRDLVILHRSLPSTVMERRRDQAILNKHLLRKTLRDSTHPRPLKVR